MRRKLFISYRREDSRDVVGWMRSWLQARLEPGTLFYDVKTVPAGVNYRTLIERVLADEAAVVLAIIGPSWIDMRLENGERCLDQDDDDVRWELELALSHRKFILPVLVRGATMPQRQQLPGSIAILADISAVSVRPDPDFDDDMRQLRAAIQQAALGP